MEELVGLLGEQVDVVGTVSDGRSLVEAAVRLQPDVVVTDISMPGMNGIESLRSLQASRVVTKVIFLTMHADSELANEALRGGAAGFPQAICGRRIDDGDRRSDARPGVPVPRSG